MISGDLFSLDAQRHLCLFVQNTFSAILPAILNFCIKCKNTFILGCFVFAVEKNNCLPFRKQYSSSGPTFPLDTSCIRPQCVLGLVFLILFFFSENILSWHVLFTPQPLRVVGVLFSPMVSGWAVRLPEKVCLRCISETVRCRKLILCRDIG